MKIFKMKLPISILVFLSLFVSVNCFGQAISGYYEYYDSLNNIVDKIIIENGKFENYYSKDQYLVFGTGSYGLTESNLTLKYDSLPEIRYFTTDGFPYGKLKKKLELSYKIDTTMYTNSFGSYKIFLIDSLGKSTDITRGYKTKHYDTLIKPSVILETDDFKVNLPISNSASIQNWVLTFDNTSMTTHQAVNKSFNLLENSVDKLVLIDNGKVKTYWKDKTVEPNFFKYLKIKQQVQIRF